MSLVVLADAQSRVGDAVTQEMIDGVETWLASQVGPLDGQRTETFYLSQRRDSREVDGLWLSRRTDAASLEMDGDALSDGTDYRLIGGLLVERISDGAAWGDTAVATYTPTDEDIVVESIYDLLSYRSTPSNLQSVRIGQYSETFFPGNASSNPVLLDIIGKIKPGARLGAYASPFRYRAHRRDRTLVEAVES